MEQQLQRILKSNLDNIDTQLIFNEEKMEDFQGYLQSKTKELSQLQNCFMKEIKQLQRHQKNQSKFKNILKMVKQMCKFFRNQLYHIKCNWVQFLLWKQNYQNKLRQLPGLFSIHLNKKQVENEKQNLNSSMKKKQNLNMSEIVHMQYKYEIQIQNLKNHITILEKELKKKINIQKSENVNSDKIKQIEQEYYRRSRQKSQNKQVMYENITVSRQKSQNKQLTFGDNIINRQKSQNKEIMYGDITISRQKSKTKILNNHNINRQQQTQYKSSNKKLIQHKKKIQLSVSEFSNSPLRVNKGFNNMQDMHKKYQIPVLPELKLNFSFVPPIMNGFQILVINGKQIYKGMWKKGLFQGRGKLYTDLWIYDGQFKNGIIQGMGSINFKNYTFIGKFMNGSANGEGTLYSRQKPITGIWKDNVLVKHL